MMFAGKSLKFQRFEGVFDDFLEDFLCFAARSAQREHRCGAGGQGERARGLWRRRRPDVDARIGYGLGFDSKKHDLIHVHVACKYICPDMLSHTIMYIDISIYYEDSLSHTHHV